MSSSMIPRPRSPEGRIPTVNDPVELVLAPTPAAAGASRRLVEDHLDPPFPREAADNLKLVLTELVANAVEHGEGDVTVRVWLRDDAVALEVADAGGRSTPHIRDHPGAAGGWGLRIVDALARRWGVYEGSTHVWAELPLGPAGS
jgi:anti-sigma regulatory factor (Ser/Thr protein kinase)